MRPTVHQKFVCVTPARGQRARAARFQFWLDVVWFDQHGYDTGPALLAALEGAVDEVAEGDLVYGACFHDWVAIASDERRVGWLRGFFRYAAERGVEVTTYTDYWRRVTGG